MSTAMKDWASVTSWHGISDLVKGSTMFSKSFWGVMIVASTFLIVAQTSLHIHTYIVNQDHPWTQVATYYRSEALKMPSVHICSTNKVTKESLSRLDLDIDAASFLVDIHNAAVHQGIRASSPVVGEQVHSKMLNAFRNHTEQYPDRKTWTVHDWALQLTPDCLSIIISASMPQRFAASGYDLCTKYIQKSIFENKICFNINLEMIWVVLAGDMQSVTIVVNSSAAQYAPIVEPMPAEHAVSLHIGFERKLGPGVHVGSMVPPSKKLWLALSTEKGTAPNTESMQIFPAQATPCHSNVSLLTMDVEFTQDRCIMDCYISFFLKACGCLYFLFPAHNNTGNRHCLPEEAHQCLTRKDDHFDEHDPCMARCTKPACVYKLVHYQVIGVTDPANLTNLVETGKTLFNSSLDQQAYSNVSQLVIFYKTLTVKVVGYKLRASVAELISNIGGQMGIWAGMSILTIIQAGTHLFYTILYKVQSLFVNAKILGTERQSKILKARSNSKKIEKVKNGKLQDFIHHHHMQRESITQFHHVLPENFTRFPSIRE